MDLQAQRVGGPSGREAARAASEDRGRDAAFQFGGGTVGGDGSRGAASVLEGSLVLAGAGLTLGGRVAAAAELPQRPDGQSKPR